MPRAKPSIWRRFCWHLGMFADRQAHRIRYAPMRFRRFVGNAYALQLLESSCTDFEIADYDWPRHRFHYRVRAFAFFASGTGYGTTLLQATKRALARMEKRQAAMAPLHVSYDETQSTER